jgi:hypothetical protein
MGRPPVKVDEELVKKLASINCTNAEIAVLAKCSEATLISKFMHLLEEGRSTGKASLKRAMWKKAIDENNTTMQIWLSKNMLGYKDQAQLEHAIAKTARLVIDMGEPKDDLPERSRQDSITLSEGDFEELSGADQAPDGATPLGPVDETVRGAV